MPWTEPEPLVSVLMPIHQAAETLPEALDGILDGTLREIELIAVDDGSTDRSLGLLRSRAGGDGRIRVFSQPHQGISAALSRALAAARAPLVARMDADDVSDPGRLERQFERLRARPHWSGLGCAIRWLPGSGTTRGMERYADWQNSLISPEEIRLGMFVENPVTHATLMVRREALIAAGGYRPCEWSEDYDLVLRLLLGGHLLGKLPEALYQWRERSGRLTRRDPHCSPEAFHRARVHYLSRHFLAGGQAASIWGVGELGSRWRRSLAALGVPVRLDPINPRAMKLSRGGRAFIPAEALPRACPGTLILIACGTRANRDLLRQAATAAALEEGEHFWCVG